MSRLCKYAILGTVVVILLPVGLGFYLYEAYPFGWPIARAVPGPGPWRPYEVVVHSVERVAGNIEVNMTVRWVEPGPVPYFGFYGQWVTMGSGPEIEASLGTYGPLGVPLATAAQEDRGYRLVPRARRARARSAETAVPPGGTRPGVPTKDSHTQLTAPGKPWAGHRRPEGRSRLPRPV